MSSRRRTDGDETWFRLQQWIKGQKPAERLAALILDSEGYKSIDPSHPLGGRDGLKDLICEKDNLNWIAASYFPRSPKQFNDIKSKFKNDFEGVNTNNVDGIVFFTNQELTLGERQQLKDIAKSSEEIEIYHLDRIAFLLDKPENYGIRLEFLDIEMTSEEQLSFIALRDQKLHKLTELVGRLIDDYSSFKNNDFDDNVRTDDEVSNALEELFDKIWYDRHQMLRHRVLIEGEEINREIWEGALASAKKVEEKYGEENLGPWSDFEWGMLNGKLSALRWFFGDEWDMLDT